MGGLSHAYATPWKPKTEHPALDGTKGRAKGHVTTALAESDIFDGDYR